ncbi:MAG: hypothetical protein BWK78_03720 [Thiotrichaceae bacterium IS1]|jgi:hypothetical protein|nr:MAG: hypothetical protein BWK78_03720 [Thiotrichaceae bacterium IS1]
MSELRDYLTNYCHELQTLLTQRDNHGQLLTDETLRATAKKIWGAKDRRYLILLDGAKLAKKGDDDNELIDSPRQD